MNDSSSARQTTWAGWWLLAFVALWPAPGIAEIALSLGSLFMLGWLAWQLRRRQALLLSPEAWALTTLLFIAYWVPELLSAVDGANAWRSLREALIDLRYLPFLWMCAMAVADATGRRRVLVGLAVIVAFWTLDGLCQAATGVSLGGPVTEDRLSGIFGSDNLKLGLVLASLSPFAMGYAGERWRTAGWVLAAALIGLVIVLAGARAAWLSFALVLLWSGIVRFGRRRALLAVVLGGALVVGLAAILSPPLHTRFERTAAVLSGDLAGLDHALSGRITIWRAAIDMSLDHPLNGVGVRGFRDAYPAYVQPGDPPLEGGVGYHAHQIVLEVLSETGVIGFVLWLSGVLMAWRAWWVAGQVARQRAYLPMMALVVTVFPFNTHLAVYSTFWGGLTLLLAALYAGTLLARDGDDDSASALENAQA